MTDKNKAKRSNLEHLEWPIGADGKQIRLGDRVEFIDDDDKRIHLVTEMTFYTDYVGGADNPTVMLHCSDGFSPEPSRVKHAYSDTLEKIFEDVQFKSIGFYEFENRLKILRMYEEANSGLFGNYEHMMSMVD